MLDEISFERVAELRILAHVAKVHRLAGAAFQRHLKIMHNDNGTELSALARSLIRLLPEDATAQQVAALFDSAADEVEAAWSDAG
jgi:hypothetical protein